MHECTAPIYGGSAPMFARTAPPPCMPHKLPFLAAALRQSRDAGGPGGGTCGSERDGLLRAAELVRGLRWHLQAAPVLPDGAGGGAAEGRGGGAAALHLGERQIYCFRPRSPYTLYREGGCLDLISPRVFGEINCILLRSLYILYQNSGCLHLISPCARESVGS
eukprot:242882-Rhodomonas_salina.2